MVPIPRSTSTALVLCTDPHTCAPSQPTIGESGVEFTKVAREWRAKYAMDADGTPAVRATAHTRTMIVTVLTRPRHRISYAMVDRRSLSR